MVKKTLFILIVLCLSTTIKAQIFWRENLEAAQSEAKKSDKLILIDFWASWCNPCTLMDRELWHNAEMQKLSKSFIGLKINVDFNKSVAIDYDAKLIPKIVLTTYTGETIWESEGYRNAEDYLSILRLLPENVKALNQTLQQLEGNKKDSKTLFAIGIEFQQIGKNQDASTLKTSFLKSSENYFSKAQKFSDDANFNEEVELNSILNDVYAGRSQKALKKIEKIKSPSTNEDISQLRHFVLAKCYANTNDQPNFQKEKQLITKKELLDKLEN